MIANKRDRRHKDAIHFSQRTPDDRLHVFFAWLPADLLHAPGIDWTHLPSQAAGYLIRSVGTSPDAAYLAMAAVTAMDAISTASLLSMLFSLHSLLQMLRTVYEIEDISDLYHDHIWNDFVARTPMPKVYRGQIKAYSCATNKHFPAYLERLSTEERSHMLHYALPPLPPDFLKYMFETIRQREESLALRQQHQQLKEQQARAYIAQRCQENADVTCQELREGLGSRGIRMGNKRVNSIRGELNLKRPGGSRAEHLRSSSVHARARDWLVQQRRLNPNVRVHTLQAGLQESFGLEIGTRQLNNILRELGVSRPGPHQTSTEASQKTSALDAD